MGRQSGPLQVTGGIGNLSFYHDRRYGYLVRKKGGASSEKVKNDPQFERTRENASEFGRASKAGKVIRTAVRGGLQFTGDNSVTQRLTQLLVRITKLDTINERGSRTFAAGLNHSEGRSLLRGLSFLEHTPFAQVIKKPVHYHSADGTFSIPELAPIYDLIYPNAATHALIQGMRCVFDFGTGNYHYSVTDTLELSLTDNAAQPLFLQPQQPLTGVEGVSIGFLKVSFFQEKNGELYALQEGKALGIW